ncbi:tRNA (adenosine(37)-N6)-threonylcarbamoyltransferase complex transferase subunit TsaD [Candidatus Dependentiae bacterium]|nr:tRNA (adenosine(37)-N6)-threonylcarbamoyltransferase complex transferase subunit TsaD [Candidatus Dependentiae bacterium]
MLILGIETSCDETGAAVFDSSRQLLLGQALFSQIAMHKIYGGVIPEIASRSQLEKIDLVVQEALTNAGVSIQDIDTIAVTNRPGLVGSLLVGICFAKGIAFAHNKKLIGIDHLEGHMFSAFLQADGTVNKSLQFPFLTFSVSGGHTALYLVKGFGEYELIGHTIDDAAGEAFDKVAKILGLGYPGGAVIERLGAEVNFEDFFKYPRTKTLDHELITFSFSGLKTAILYDLVKRGAYDMNTGPIKEAITPELQRQVSSSLLVCIGDIFQKRLKEAFKKYPTVSAVTFVGGVACNKYLRARLLKLCNNHRKQLVVAPPAFCTDNGAMIAFVGSYKAEQGLFDNLDLDVIRP